MNNMEIFPKFEKKEEREINEEELIEKMKGKEPGDAEAVEVLRKWVDQEQGKTEDNLGFNIKMAEVYEKAGWKEQARESFEAAAEYAYEIDDERYEELLGKAGEMEKGE
ncbi:MAG: hypothetical protein WC435_00510 [Candidatus Paceibacterota bacterium]